ncbi:putative efflux protein EncT [Mrakia frigida]|uniref:putative efflux protein EncT n=1 Tax=Mrakia frigida TaxID=29902 RepID=UPI003FCC0F35
MSAPPSPTTPTTPTLHRPHSFLTRVPTSAMGELQRVASSRHDAASRTSTRHGNEGSVIEEAARVEEAEAQTLGAPPPLSSGRKWALLAIFSLAQFLDVVLVSSMFIATEQITIDLGLDITSSVWVIGAYSLTFASFLLLGGRLSDLYSPKIIFLSGFFTLGAICLCTSFWEEKHGFLVFRALAGIAGAMTIPSAIRIIIETYRDPSEQARALNIFGLSGALGNVLGLVIAGVLMLASWRWIFRFFSILLMPGTFLGFWLIPKRAPHIRAEKDAEAQAEPKWRRMDGLGCALMLSTLIMFILALTNGNINGWPSANFIAPIAISGVLFVLFFVWESTLKESHALFQLKALKYPNFLILMLLCLNPYTWWACTQAQWAIYFQAVRHYTPIDTAAHLLPQGIIAMIMGAIPTAIPRVLNYPHVFVPIAVVFQVAGMILQIFSYGDKYWSRAVPGFVLGSGGTTWVFTGINVALIQQCPPEIAGFAGALANVLFQIGAVTGLAIQSAITNAISRDLSNWRATQGGFWFVMSWSAFTGLMFLIFFDQKKAQAGGLSYDPNVEEVKKKEAGGNI